ncbi:MAG: hypothetical protein LRY73_13525 [Bacillus sp. (in: Bacteria)]|nr:hypothetical protein [Bacillus sp. (in: firmicutes)]
MTKLARSAAPGSDGLLFLPYLNGERAPHWNTNARGSYIGLANSHKKEHMLRAGLEGVIFNLYDVSSALNRLAGPTKKLYASGGFSRSPFWLQILADIFGQEIYIPESHQSSAWGAAWYSLMAVNHVEDLASIKKSIPMKEVIQPNIQTHETYAELYSIYKELYGSLEASFDKLATIQRSAVAQNH